MLHCHGVKAYPYPISMVDSGRGKIPDTVQECIITVLCPPEIYTGVLY